MESLGTDKPNEDLGLSGLQLRQRFDAAVTAIKAWINDTFLAEISGTGGAANIGITQIGSINGYDVQSALQGLYEMSGDTRDASITNSKLSSELKIPTENIADGAVTFEKLGSSLTVSATGTLYSSGWDGTEEPYTQTVTLTTLKGFENVPRISLNASETYETAVLEKEGWGYIVDADFNSETGEMKFRASDKPEADMIFTCEVNKK